MSQPLVAVDAQIPSPVNEDACPVADHPVSAVISEDTLAQSEQPPPETAANYQNDCSIAETAGDVPLTQERPSCPGAQALDVCQQGLGCDEASSSEVNAQQDEVGGCVCSPGVAVQETFAEQAVEMCVPPMHVHDGPLVSPEDNPVAMQQPAMDVRDVPSVSLQNNPVSMQQPVMDVRDVPSVLLEDSSVSMQQPVMDVRDGSSVLLEHNSVSVQQPVMAETREIQIDHQMENICEDANNHIPPIHDGVNEGAQEPVTEDDMDIGMTCEAKEASVDSNEEMTEAPHHVALSVSDCSEQHIPDAAEAITSDSINLDDNQHRQLPPPFFPAGSLAAVLTCLRDGNAMISNVVNQLRHVNMILEEKSGVEASSDKMPQIPV